MCACIRGGSGVHVDSKGTSNTLIEKPLYMNAARVLGYEDLNPEQLQVQRSWNDYIYTV